MDLLFDTDENHIVCTLTDGANVATVTASNPEAADALQGALDEARETGFGECLWIEAGGEYRWMFRRNDDRLIVVVLWSAGTLTGWQHVFRTDTDFAWFAERMGTEVAGLGTALRGH